MIGGGVNGYCDGELIAAASASTNSVAVCGLRAGSFARPASKGCSTTGGRLGLNFLGDGAGVSWWAAITPSGVGALNGTRPVTISNAMIASA